MRPTLSSLVRRSGRRTAPLAIALALGCGGPTHARSGSPGAGALDELTRLMASCDRDGDGRITLRDERAGVPLEFTVGTRSGALTARGPAALARLADRLAHQAALAPRSTLALTPAELSAPRAQELRRLLARSWAPLTRRADQLDDLLRALHGSRLRPRDGRDYIYVPEDDPAALAQLRREAGHVPGNQVVVVPIPRRLDAAWLARLDAAPGLLYLPHPYVVPGGIFNEMFGWDSYFMARGAMADGRLDLAVAMLENFIYQIEHYGKIGNSNRSIHRGRSQPPFFARLALAVVDRMPASPARTDLLRRAALAAERELREVWLAPPRITDTGLSLYHDESTGRPPEVRPALYREWRDTEDFYAHQRAVRESGWDMTHRFGERAHLIAPVCLNALLYAYERDLAEIHRRLDGAASPDAARLEAAASARKSRIDALMWDASRGLYMDWDTARRARTDYEHVGSFYALWAGLASPEQARAVVANLGLFEMPGGLSVSSERSRRAAGGEDLQWDWPNGWPPHQVLAVEGLRRYGYGAEAERVSLAWLSMLLDVAGQFNGLVKEKYDVVQRSAHVAAEYGNQGGDRGAFAAYPEAGCARWPRPLRCVHPVLALGTPPPVGFGWSNASFGLLWDALAPAARARLD